MHRIRPHRAAVVLGLVLLSLTSVAASAVSLGGFTSAHLFAWSRLQAAVTPTVVMADNFTTATAVEGRVPESVFVGTGSGTKTWHEAAGRWSVRNGYLDPPMSANSIVTYPAGLADLNGEVVVTITGAYQFGLVMRSDLGASQYLVGYVSSTGTAALAKVIGNATTVLASTSVVASTGTFTVGVRAVGSLLELRRDGVLLVSCLLSSADVATFSLQTHVGVWVSSSGNERLDDIRITTVT